jgi:transposase
MAPVLAVTLSLLILEPDMPSRKPTKTQTGPAAAKTPTRKPRQPRNAAPAGAEIALLKTLNPHAAGIDIGTTEFWVGCPPGASLPPLPPGHHDNLPAHVRRFGTFTADMVALADTLQQAGVTTVAMEATGVYWIPLYDLLESRGLRPILVDPRQTRDTPGRPKTDVKDCMWIQRLHSLGLLRAAFRPDEAIRVLREYQRHRQSLVEDQSRFVQRMQKALEQMNVKLAEVISDVTGMTGLAIIKAIVAGERDPKVLAGLRQRRCQNDEATIALALQGTWRPEHLFELGQCLKTYEHYQGQVAECDKAIEEHLKTMALPEKPGPLPPDKRGGRRRQGNEPYFDARARLYEALGVDLTAIEGIGAGTALAILGEIGTDMSRWANEKKFGAWLGLAPNPKKSGGRLKSAKTRVGASRAALAFRLAARSLIHSKSALGAFLRRIAARRGMPKAITATAYKLARIVYGMLKHGSAYVAKGAEEYEKAYRERVLRGLKRKAAELGLEVVDKQSGAATT